MSVYCLIYAGIVLVGAVLWSLGWLGQRRCRRLLMFDADDDVKDAAKHGELAELHDAMDVQAIEAELFRLVPHQCNGRLTVSPDGTDDTYSHPCSGCQRIRVLHHQLQQAEAKEGT